MLYLGNRICNTKAGSLVLWPWCPCVCVEAPAWISSLQQQSADVTCIIIRYLIAVSGWMEGGTWGAWQCVCCCCCRVIVICDEDRGSLSTAEKFYKDMIKLLCEILTVTGILNSHVLTACPEGVLTNMFRLCRTRNVQGCSSEIQDFFQQTL